MNEPRSVPRRRLWPLLVALAIVPAGLAGMAMAAAWDHNPMEEFHGADGIHWAEWLFIGGSWFLALYLPLIALALVIRTLVGRRVRSRFDGPAG